LVSALRVVKSHILGFCDGRKEERKEEKKKEKGYFELRLILKTKKQINTIVL
jgi:hypothetical protein